MTHALEAESIFSLVLTKKWWLLFKANEKFPDGRSLRPGWLVSLLSSDYKLSFNHYFISISVWLCGPIFPDLLPFSISGLQHNLLGILLLLEFDFFQKRWDLVYNTRCWPLNNFGPRKIEIEETISVGFRSFKFGGTYWIYFFSWVADNFLKLRSLI